MKLKQPHPGLELEFLGPFSMLIIITSITRLPNVGGNENNLPMGIDWLYLV